MFYHTNVKLNSVAEDLDDTEVMKLFNKSKSLENHENKSTPFVFSLKNRIGGLARALRVFQVISAFFGIFKKLKIF